MAALPRARPSKSIAKTEREAHQAREAVIFTRLRKRVHVPGRFAGAGAVAVN
jgi:hypothetical protein